MSNYFKAFDQQGVEFVSPREREFSRILSAAVVNVNFRNLLLADPEKAISSGFAGEDFHLAKEEAKRLSLIHAGSLAEFASQINGFSI
jgi:hypothetical protein